MTTGVEDISALPEKTTTDDVGPLGEMTMIRANEFGFVEVRGIIMEEVEVVRTVEIEIEAIGDETEAREVGMEGDEMTITAIMIAGTEMDQLTRKHKVDEEKARTLLRKLT